MSDSTQLPSVGDALPTFVEGPLTRTDLVRYQGASGDMNPIHHDDEFAQASGYPGVFAVGMRQAGVLATLLADTFGAGSVRHVEFRFEQPAWPGDVLSYDVDVVPSGDQPGLALNLQVRRQTGAVHISGRAVVSPTRYTPRAPTGSGVGHIPAE